ncbi:hypothetical protein Cadr_000025915 [Camelus dromedarius]|uniref:Uncharacterized protein n=1 Tax=Camelus dromedarius TaxID=9838 RepID=A0A5N4CE58_CAMDR|nr:hypothetical protein Cadr_000025915 [Camelus dromedarius]
MVATGSITPCSHQEYDCWDFRPLQRVPPRDMLLTHCCTAENTPQRHSQQEL